MRAALTALGIAIGIAAMVAVFGISASSKADLLAELDRLGTNLLQVDARAVVPRRVDAKLPTDRAGDDPAGRTGGIGGGDRERVGQRAAHRTGSRPLETGGI